MKKVNLPCLLFLILIAISCKRFSLVEENSADESLTVPRAVITDPPQIKALPIVLNGEYTSGYVPGDHTQHMLDLTYSESDPSRIYMGQDVANIWVSTDRGLNWSTLKNQGLFSPFVISIEADPLNKNRLLAAVQCRHYDGVNQGYQGIYQSMDGGISWQKRMARADLGEVRSSTKLITYAPTSKDVSAGYAQRWYAAFGEYKKIANDSVLTADDGLLVSRNGGQDWEEIRKLPSGTYGSRIRGIKVHTTNPDKVFLYGNEGLFRFEDATNSNGTVTKLSGTGRGLPAGDIWGRLYQSANGSTLIVAVSGQGIYKSINSGANWTLLYDWPGIRYCYVNEKFPNRIFAVPQQGNLQMRISTDGSTFNTVQTVNYRSGYGGSDWIKKLNGDFSCILFPNHTNPNLVFMHTKSKNFRSTDGGVTWNISDYGFNGTSHKATEQMFDPTNANRFCYFSTDRGPVYTGSQGQQFTNNNITPGSYGLDQKTSVAGALHPDSAKRTILAMVGESSGGKLFISQNNGQTWDVAAGGNNSKARWVIAYDLQNPQYCYQSNERSTNHGVTWSPLTNMPAGSIICGVSRTHGNIIYAMDALGNNGKRRVFRSSDRGDNWGDAVFVADWDLTWPGPSNRFVFNVNPANKNIVYTSSADGRIQVWNLDLGTNRTLPIPAGANPFIHMFAIDPRFPNVMYAANQRANTGNTFFRSNDGGATWQNISNYIPQGDITGVAVSPVTGEVYVSGQNGSMVMLPPYSTSNTAYGSTARPLNHITQLY